MVRIISLPLPTLLRPKAINIVNQRDAKNMRNLFIYLFISILYVFRERKRKTQNKIKEKFNDLPIFIYNIFLFFDTLLRDSKLALYIDG